MKKLLLFAFLVLANYAANAQNYLVSTFAGNGDAGYRDSTGSNATFNRPNGVAVDRRGNVFVADTENHRIRKISPSGVVTTFAGSGTASYVNAMGTAAGFNRPSCVAVDSSGTVYVGDNGNHRIRKISPMGLVSTLSGSGDSFEPIYGADSVACFFEIRGISVDANGYVYVNEGYDNSIRKVSPNGFVNVINWYGSYGGCVAVDAIGSVYYAGYGPTINKINTNGTNTLLAGSQNRPRFDGVGTSASFFYPTGLTVDRNENIYVIDFGVIRKISPQGLVTTIAGVPNGNYGFADGIGSQALFNNPNGIAVDSSGNIYVADIGNNRIRKLTPDCGSTSLITRNICEGDNFVFGSRTFNTSGLYKDTVANARGCDSVIYLQLIVNPIVRRNVLKAFCYNDEINYTFGSRVLTDSGTYTETLINRNGCDSIVQLKLIIYPRNATNLSRTICQGSSYNFNSRFLTEVGIYMDTLTGGSGCDSIVILNLTVIRFAYNTVIREICQNSSFIFNSRVLRRAGIYIDTLINVNGCDSIVNLDLRVKRTSVFYITESLCEGYSYWFNSRRITESGTYVDSLLKQNGCDSIVALFLTVLPNPLAPRIIQTSEGLVADSVTNGIYTWYKNGAFIRGFTSRILPITFINGQNANYSVRVKVGDCRSEVSSVFVLGTAERIGLASMKIYPNPAENQFVVEVEKPTKVQVLNSLGQVVMSFDSEDRTIVDATLLASGMYTVLAEGYKAASVVVSR